MNNKINQQFDQLTQSHPDKTLDAIVFLKAEMEKNDCKFGEDLIPTFLKPFFLPHATSQNIANVIHVIIDVLEKVTHLYFTNPELKDFFYIDKKAEELIKMDHGYSRNVVISRPDSFFANDILKFVEFNCDSPAGAGYTDAEENIQKTMFPFTEIANNFELYPHHRLDDLLSALLSCYEEFAGKNKKPNIAIVDWNEVRTQNEFRILKKHFMSKGYDTTIADPRELKFSNGKLEHKGFSIDLVYRRAIFKELMERRDDVQNFLKAYKAGKICVVNPFRSRLASTKAILSIITNPKQYRSLFTEEENHIIQHHVPWTRRVKDIQTNHGNDTVFLRKHIVNHKDHLVLKPSDSYGGKNVYIGCETNQNEWDALVEGIITHQEDWVVQRYVQIPQMSVPVVEGNKISYQTKKINFNPFVFNGRYAGSVARLSDQSVINVSAGGGLIPVIEYEERHKDKKTQ